MIKAKICYISPLAIHSYRWIEAFSKRNYKVHLITDSHTWVAPKIEFASVYTLPSLNKTNLAQRLVPNTLKIAKLLRTLDPDLIHLHVQHHYSFAIALARKSYILTSWGVEVLSLPDADIFTKSLAKLTAKKASVLTADANCLRQIWMEMGVPKGKIKIIPFGVDTNIFNPKVKGDAVRSKLQIRKNDITVISTRPFYNDHYNIECLIRAIPAVVNSHKNVKFIIKGAGPLKNYLGNLVRKLKISNYVRFVGLVPYHEISEYLSASDIYVSTCFIDSTSVSLLEAMACGVAPIVTDIPGNREWIENGINGLLFQPKNSTALAEKIIQLIENEDARKHFGERCIRIVKQRASWENCVDRMEAIYQSLL